jgi:hypothetical protein
MIYFYVPQRGYTNIKERKSFTNSSDIFNSHFSIILQKSIINTLFLFQPSENTLVVKMKLNHVLVDYSGTTIALPHETEERDSIWGPKKPTIVLEITFSESHARLYRDVELVRVGHLAALRITIKGRMVEFSIHKTPPKHPPLRVKVFCSRMPGQCIAVTTLVGGTLMNA